VHRDIVNTLHQKFLSISVVVNGATREEATSLNIEKFLKNSETRLFIGNIKAAGVGWSAKGVSDVAFAEMDWAPGNHLQCEDRCHGIGRGEKNVRSTSYYLVGRGTLEEELCALLQRKQKNSRRCTRQR